MLASLADGKSEVRNFLWAEDTMSTLRVLGSLGIQIDGKEGDDKLTVTGAGLHGMREPDEILYCGNSGTTMRMMSGILAGQPFFSVMSGDASLNSRPMRRVVEPLRKMGANVLGRDGGNNPPLAISGGKLSPISFTSPVPSAQVKSAVLLAGLFAEGTTEVIETSRSRDHTERMLRAFGADIKVDALRVSVKGMPALSPVAFDVPGDFSSAAFFIAAALLVEGSDVTVRSVCLNPTRTGLLEVLKQMGADIEIVGKDAVSGEPVGDIHCRATSLQGVKVSGDIMPSLIDEFPVLCILAAFADGESEIRDAGELRVKESDRIAAVSSGLKRMGAEVDELDDGIIIKGGGKLKGAEINSHGDHRIAMAFSVAGLLADGETKINGADAVNVSFPGFYEQMKALERA
jgi:3-phosphoshikimate 1-carboxyvinyltransferase